MYVYIIILCIKKFYENSMVLTQKTDTCTNRNKTEDPDVSVQTHPQTADVVQRGKSYSGERAASSLSDTGK